MNESGTLVIASHNNNSVYKIMDYIEYLDSEEKQKFYKNRMHFGTLYGLNDFLAYQCLYSGYMTFKGLCNGEREATIPFMIRRGIECKDVL